MAMMSLYEIVQRTARRLSLPVPNAAFSSTDPTWMQGVEILQDLGEELAQNEWPALITQKSITITATNFTATTLPADWGNVREDAKLYRVITMTPLVGPLQSEEWQQLTIYGAGFIPGAWRLANNAINIYGVAVGEVVKLEYTSSYWITNSTGLVPSATWKADTDLPLIPDRLLRLGLQWKWKRAKGFDYGEEKDIFERAMETELANARGMRTIQTSSPLRGFDVNDTTWPGVITP